MTPPKIDTARHNLDQAIDELRKDLIFLRPKVGYTQGQVARELGIKQATLSAFERRKNHSLRPHTLAKLRALIDDWCGQMLEDHNESTVETGKIIVFPSRSSQHESTSESGTSENEVAQEAVSGIHAYVEKRLQIDLGFDPELTAQLRSASQSQLIHIYERAMRIKRESDELELRNRQVQAIVKQEEKRAKKARKKAKKALEKARDEARRSELNCVQRVPDLLDQLSLDILKL